MTASSELTQLAVGLLPYLEAEGWTLSPSQKDYEDCRVYFQKGELRFAVSEITYPHSDRGKLHVQTWVWPSYTYMERGDNKKNTIYPRDLYDPKESDPSIKVSASRGPQAVAKDIMRRFIPEYERLYARCKEKADLNQGYQDTCYSNWAAVCKLIAKDPRYDSHYIHLGRDSHHHIHIEKSGEEAKLDLYVTPEDLTKVLAALK